MAEEGGDRRAEETHHPLFYRKKTLDEEKLLKVAREGSLQELSAALGELWGEFRQYYSSTEGKRIGTMEHRLRTARERQSGKVFVTPKKLRRRSSRLTMFGDDDSEAYFDEAAIRQWYGNCCGELQDIARKQGKAAREKVESWFRCLESLDDESPVQEPTTAAEIVQVPPDFYEFPRDLTPDDETADLTMPATWKGSCLAYAGAVCALYALALSFLFPLEDAGVTCEEEGTLAWFFKRLDIIDEEKNAFWLKFFNVSLD